MSPKMNNLPDYCVDNALTFLRRECLSPKMNTLPDDCVDNVLTFLRPVRQKENKKQPLVSARLNTYSFTDLMTKGIRPYEDYFELVLATRHLKYAKDKKPIVVEIMTGQYYKSNKTLYSWFVNNEIQRQIKKVPSTETVIQNPVEEQAVVVEVDGRMYEGVIKKIYAKTIHIDCHHGQHGRWFKCIARRI